MPRTIEVKVYKFNELSEESKNKAINGYITFLLETYTEEFASDELRRAVNDSESMRTPWFAGEYVWDYCKDEILYDLNHNQEEYYEDGSIA
jgi:hypothetical protein